MCKAFKVAILRAFHLKRNKIAEFAKAYKRLDSVWAQTKKKLSGMSLKTILTLHCNLYQLYNNSILTVKVWTHY